MSRLFILLVLSVSGVASADAATALENPALPGLTARGKLGARLEAARRKLGPKYVARTRHRAKGGGPKYTNRLVLEASPYLQQHAHNPVNWYPWGEEAFARARAEGKPLFLSIGYSTCHWCHVMEKESFEDEDIAAQINANFIPVKIDREEHPDIDAVYMTAVYALNGRGGWPMTVVATPEGKPFFAATYLPPRDSPGRGRGLSSVLAALSELYREEPARVAASAQQITEQMLQMKTPPAKGKLPTLAAIDGAVAQLASSFDATNGGFGGAPKFPTPATVELALRTYRRTRDPKVLAMATRTLEAMAQGGIHDQLGGGFHRYATDAAWRVPHFEKMLYDNAQLASLYLDAYQVTGRADFAVVARKTLAYLEREMVSPEGAFFSATDADSPVPGQGEELEGYFFTWTPEQLTAVVGKTTGAHLAAVYGVSAQGNLDGRSVLYLPGSTAQVAKTLGLETAVLQREIDASRPRLLAARAKRPPPATDEKIIAAWNGLAISAFARGAVVLEDPALAQRAAKVAEFVTGPMLKDGRLARTWRSGRLTGPGTLEDYAFVEQGLLDLHEATQDTRWLERALALQAATDAHFGDPKSGAYFRSPDDAPRVLLREVPDNDGAEPSGNSIAALNGLRLFELTDEVKFQERALDVLRAQASVATRGFGAAKLLCALDFTLGAPAQVVIVEAAPSAGAGLVATMRQVYAPNHVFVRAVQGDDFKQKLRVLPLLEGRVARKGRATAYVCRHRTCELPTSDPAVFRRQLEKREPPNSRTRGVSP